MIESETDKAWEESKVTLTEAEEKKLKDAEVKTVDEQAKKHAEEILAKGEADVIFLGRELLRNPYWSLYAEGEIEKWPVQYQRSFEGSNKINYIRET